MAAPPVKPTVSQISEACGPNAFGRGQRYFQQGRVLSLQWNASQRELSGRVEGREAVPYEQVVYIGRGRDPEIDGECDCPVGYNCKHVAALLIAWSSQDEQRPREEGLERWRQRLESRLASRHTPPPEPVVGRDTLLYLLQHRQGHEGPELRLEVVRTRWLKVGGWGKRYGYNLIDVAFSYYHPPEWVTEEDRLIARLVVGSGYGHGFSLEGEAGLLLLRRLVATGRCYFDSPDRSPLHFAPPRPAHFSWADTDEGRRLQVELADTVNWVLVPSTPPCYIDTATGACGAIEQPLEEELFRSLCELPPLPSSKTAEFSRYLLPLLPAGADLPLPAKLDLRPLAVPARPVVGLRGLSYGEGIIHVARLSFRYQDLEVAPFTADGQNRLLLQHDGIEWDLQRDLEGEARALQRLAGHGFIPVVVDGDTAQLDFIVEADNRAESAVQWRAFMEQLPALEADGWEIRRDADFRLRFDSVEAVTADIAADGEDWFDIGLSVDLAGQRIELLPLVTQWLQHGDTAEHRPLLFEAEPGHWVELPNELVRGIADTLVELYDAPGGGEGRLRLSRHQAARLDELERRTGGLAWQGGEQVRALGKKLRNFAGIVPVAPPTGLRAELRAYQQRGLDWLQFLREYGFAGVLADDMGLGKTLQTLTHLLLEKEAGRLTQPALVVAPTSLLGNWRREAERFAPALRVLVLHGPARKEWFERLGEFDLVITNYPLLPRDETELSAQRFSHLILDEAQTIKNPRAKAAEVVRGLAVDHRLCLTGTPLENHLGELWALFDFLMPGFLGEERRFNRLYRNPIEKEGDAPRREALAERIAPFMLRRTKQAVAAELPPKTEILRSVDLEPDQRRLYETIRTAMAEKVRQLLASKGLKRSHIEVLDALLKLRQVCCDPRLVKLESARKVRHSAKLALLMEMLPELLEEGRRILIFSQFSTMLGLIEQALTAANIPHVKLTGQTRKRDAVIERFQGGEVPVFLISLKAGGTGLNLTEADTVIHYDPWWNPAVEAQATDRAHRIGQDKPVFVYKLIAAGTVEEKIVDMQQRKQALADGIYGKRSKEQESALTADQILALFSEG